MRPLVNREGESEYSREKADKIKFKIKIKQCSIDREADRRKERQIDG